MPTLKQVRRWGAEVEAIRERIGHRFPRREHAGRYLHGLLSRVERKNGWQLAEELGEATPVNLQHFIARAEWNAEAVRDDLRSYVVEHLGDPQGVLIVDETGFLKTGTKSVGVKRQYSPHRRPHRELPGRRVSGLQEPTRSRADRSRAVPAARMGRRSSASRRGQGAGLGGVRHQASAGASPGGAGSRGLP